MNMAACGWFTKKCPTFDVDQRVMDLVDAFIGRHHEVLARLEKLPVVQVCHQAYQVVDVTQHNVNWRVSRKHELGKMKSLNVVKQRRTSLQFGSGFMVNGKDRWVHCGS